MHIPWDLTVERTILQILFRLLGHKCTKRCAEFPPTTHQSWLLRAALRTQDWARAWGFCFSGIDLFSLSPVAHPRYSRRLWHGRLRRIVTAGRLEGQPGGLPLNARVANIVAADIYLRTQDTTFYNFTINWLYNLPSDRHSFKFALWVVGGCRIGLTQLTR